MKKNVKKDDKSLITQSGVDRKEILKKKYPEIKYFKYDMPIPNVDPDFKGLPKILEESEKDVETITTKLFDELKLNENSSYDQYELELSKRYNN